jgi:aromatic-amino-acid transaminase
MLALGGATGLFDGLERKPADPLLALIGLYRADRRADKLDLGVGVYRDDSGATPVMRAVKQAEYLLADGQATKAYLGPEGDIGFIANLKPLIFGPLAADRDFTGVQTPGGTGALRLAAELIAAASPESCIWIGTPTWPNHQPIMQAAGLSVRTYRYFDPATQTVRFDEMMAALDDAVAGDLVLLHGCCHNPSGADLDLSQWLTVADLLAERGLIPLIDLAYQGIGGGLDADVAGLRALLERAGEALIAYSCDKNFGLYRERTGALYALAANAAALEIVQSNLLALARANWSMPPDHGAAIVRMILESDDLTADWKAELETMRCRIADVRVALAAADPAFAAQAGQRGIFSLLPLTPAQVARLRDEHAIYMPASGRINVAGLTAATVHGFARAVAACGQGGRS